jgi:hypothetical protein
MYSHKPINATLIPVSEQVFLQRNYSSSPPSPPDAIRSIFTPLLKEFWAYRRSGNVCEGGVRGMRQQQVNSKKILIAPFINYVSSCQTHKSRTWKWGAEINWVSGNTYCDAWYSVFPSYCTFNIVSCFCYMKFFLSVYGMYEGQTVWIVCTKLAVSRITGYTHEGLPYAICDQTQWPILFWG